MEIRTEYRTVEGYIRSTGSKTTTDPIAIQSSSSPTNKRRGYIEFPLTNIPFGAIISRMQLKICAVGFAQLPINVVPLTIQPSISTGAALWADIGAANPYLENLTMVTGYCLFEDLPAQALSDLENAIKVGWYALGFNAYGGEAQGEKKTYLRGGWDSSNGFGWIYIFITYTLPGGGLTPAILAALRAHECGGVPLAAMLTGGLLKEE